MKKYKTLLLIPVILIFTGCVERGMLLPLTSNFSRNITHENKSDADSLQEGTIEKITIEKNTVVARSDVKQIEKDESTFLDREMQNIIAGTCVALIGLAMLI